MLKMIMYFNLNQTVLIFFSTIDYKFQFQHNYYLPLKAHVLRIIIICTVVFFVYYYKLNCTCLKKKFQTQFAYKYIFLNERYGIQKFIEEDKFLIK